MWFFCTLYTCTLRISFIFLIYEIKATNTCPLHDITSETYSKKIVVETEAQKKKSEKISHCQKVLSASSSKTLKSAAPSVCWFNALR